MSRPAAPKSETPENVQCSICLAPPPYGGCAGDEACAYTMLLQRRIDLLLTEIKGHMRVEDDLKRDLADEVAIVGRVWKALGIETYEDAKPFAIDEHVARLKMRIAELEKDAARLDALEREIGDSPLLLHNGGSSKGFRGLGLANTGRTLRKAIDDMTYANEAALKDRA